MVKGLDLSTYQTNIDYKGLKAKGIEEGDVVRMYYLEFDYYE